MNKNNVEELKSEYPIDFAYAKGEHVYFRYLTEEDARGEWHLWFNSPSITRYLLARKWTNTVEDQLEYLKYAKTTKDRLTLAIVDIKSNKHIGVGSLGHIEYIHKHAEISCVIGAKDFHKGYYALESFAMLTEIGFTRLNLNKIYGAGLEINRPGIELSKLLGYKVTGRLNEHCFADGQYKDALMLEIFQRDWLKSDKRPKIC